MPTETAAQDYARLAAEANALPFAAVDPYGQIAVDVSHGETVWICLDDDDGITGTDSTGVRWPWVHDTIADYLTERARTNNWTF